MPDTPIPVLPPKEAIAYFGRKGLAKSFAWADIWAAQHDYFFTVAKMLETSLLEEVHGLIVDALKDGRSPQELGKNLKQLLRARGWWGKQLQDDPLTGETKPVQIGSNHRVRTIVNTNLRTSYSAGRYARQERVSTLLDILVYKSRMDGRERPQHHAWHNTALPIGHPWWKTHYGPCDWGCRCRTVSMSRKMAERRGLKVGEEPAFFGTRKWVNKRTGEVIEVEKGIGAGWDYHPGRAPIEGLAPEPLFGFSKTDEGESDATASAGPSAIGRFLDRFDLSGTGGVWRDATGWPLAISRRWLKGLSTQRQQLAGVVIQAVTDPDEIRAVWVRGKDGRAMLMRRYLLRRPGAGYVVDIGAHIWRFARVSHAAHDRLGAKGAMIWAREGMAEASYNPRQPRDRNGRWTSGSGGGLGNFITAAIGDPHRQDVFNLGTVTSGAIPDIQGFSRQLSAEMVRKVMNKHGHGGYGRDRHPIEKDHFALIPEIAAKGTQREKHSRSGIRKIEYRHQIAGRDFIYVEVVGMKRQRVTAKTFYTPNSWTGDES